MSESKSNYNNITYRVDVSILIRTKNEEAYIGKTLDAIFSQSCTAFEVIIVDSGSTDRTREIVRRYPVKIYEIRPEDFTFGYSLNYGFQRANGEYVVCLSAHAVPLSNDWLGILISNFKKEHIAAVMCKTVPWPDCNPFDRRGLLKKFNIEKQEIRGGHPFIFANYGSAIRKKVWEEINFDESLTASEDHDWAIKVEKLGYKIMYEPEARIYHSHNESLKQIYRRFHRESYANQILEIKGYTILSMLYDLFAGSIYDMLYVLYKRDNLKWFFFAPFRRMAMNYGRYKAIRMIK